MGHNEMRTVEIQIAARELHEAAARFGILNESDGHRYNAAFDRFESAKEKMRTILEKAGPVPNEAKMAS